MGDSQHFCLRWNNYQSSITSAFENLRDDEDFVDVTLACDGKSLKAHRVVLSACSPYFRELLKSTPCKHPVIVLQDVSYTDLAALVEFIYHGEVNVHQRSLNSFLKTAEVLKVSGLTQQHGEDSPQLAQVHQMIKYQQPQANLANHHPFGERMLDDAIFAAPMSPPHGATVNQLLRKAAIQHHRRERRISSDPENEHKRARSDHIMSNNNNNELNLTTHSIPPQTQPADFSPSGLKNNSLINSTVKAENEGNGISSTEREGSPCSTSPSANNKTTTEDSIKSEPMDLLCSTNQEDNSNDSGDTHNDNGPNLPQGPHSGSSGGDNDDHDSSVGPYLTPQETKLYAAGSYNFNMAAFAAESGLGDSKSTADNLQIFFNNKKCLNQTLPPNPDSLAGTSQGLGVFRCEPCNKSLSSMTRLKRHMQNVHMRPSREPVCNICKRVYSSLNSLRNHKSIYHRNVKAIKTEDVLPHHPYYNFK